MADTARSVLDLALDGAHGHLWQAKTASGTVFHRVPADGLAQVTDPALSSVSCVTSGVRLRIATDAPWVEVRAQLIVIDSGHGHDEPVFDAVVDGQIVDSAAVREALIIYYDAASSSVTFTEGGPATVRLRLPEGSGVRDVEIWLPHAAGSELLDVRVPGTSVTLPASEAGLPWLHYGSSISQASEARSPAQTWVGRVARRADVAVTNLGLAGSCHLDPFMARAIAERPAAFISLEVGINIAGMGTLRERTFVPAVHGFLDLVRAAHPRTPLVLVSPIYCPFGEEEPGPFERGSSGPPGGLTLRRVRELLDSAVELRRTAGDDRLFYLDGLELLGASDADRLPDDLHPDADGYDLMAERFFAYAFAAGGPFAAV